MSDNDSGSIGWFLAGLGLGALVGVLYAPKSGQETRQALVEGAGQGREYLTNTSRQAKEQVSQWVDKSKDVVNRQKDQLNSAVEAGRQAYRDVTGPETATKKG